MSVLVVGISHKTAPVPVLERVALDADGVQKLIREVTDSEHVIEATVLSTCNRTEVYADVDRSLWAAAEWSVKAQIDYLTDRDRDRDRDRPRPEARPET